MEYVLKQKYDIGISMATLSKEARKDSKTISSFSFLFFLFFFRKKSAVMFYAKLFVFSGFLISTAPE